MTAATGRADYDQAVQVSSLTAGEPIFIIRAGDAVSGDAVRAWAALAFQKGAPVEAVELALQQADVMDAWQTKKIPDGPSSLKPGERLQLRNLFSRRAWKAREAAPTPALALAERRGADAVLGRLRPLLTLLTPKLRGQGPAADAIEALEPVLKDIYALVGWSLRPKAERD